MDRGLVTSWIHQSPISTPLNTHRYLVPASLIGGSLWGVRNPDQCPHLHHWTPIDKVARVPATPTGRPRRPRHPSGDPGGTGIDAELGLADPASLAWALTAADSGAGPPLHRGWALGSTPARDLGRKVGGEKEEEEGRERETDGRVSPTPWHATIWSSATHLLYRHVGGRGRSRWNPPGPNLPVHPAPEQLAVLLLVLDEGTETSFLVRPHVQQRLMVFLVESRERLDDIRKWRSRWWGHDGSGDPASFPGFGTSVTRFVRRKEADRVGSWRLGWFIEQINLNMCALCASSVHQLSRLSQCSLSVFVLAVSRSQTMRPSLHSFFLLEFPLHGGFIGSLHANYCNQTQVFLILHLTHLLTAVSWVFLPLQTSLNHAPLAT